MVTPQNQLLLKVPRAPTDKIMPPNHPRKTWVENVNNQLGAFKDLQTNSFLPQMSHEVLRYSEDHHIQTLSQNTKRDPSATGIKSVGDEL